MTQTTETENDKFIILKKKSLEVLQWAINEAIEEWYVPYGQIDIRDWDFYIAMIDKELTEVVVKEVKKVTAIGVVWAVASLGSIWWTVKVSVS